MKRGEDNVLIYLAIGCGIAAFVIVLFALAPLVVFLMAREFAQDHYNAPPASALYRPEDL